nr:retrovirus-related Pol polyprotein from transposon TNT 1-94 [Tanacetum cinerariifolium]
MTRRSSNRNKKVHVKFNDMIHDLSTKGPKSKNSCGEDMVKLAENDKETGESDVVTDCGIDGGRSEEEMEEVAECLGMGKKACEATGIDPNSSNVSKSGKDDSPSPGFSVYEKLIEKQRNTTDNMENNSYVEALSKNLIESDNKLFTVPTRVNDKGEEVVIFDEDLVNEGTRDDRKGFLLEVFKLLRYIDKGCCFFCRLYTEEEERGEEERFSILTKGQRMTGAKFDIEKFDGTGDFGLWRVKMRDLLIQHGCAAALEALPTDMEAQAKAELNKKAHSVVILCLGNKVLREVTGETTAAGVWSKLETLYMTKSLANKLYLKKKLYTFYMSAG